MSKVWSLMDILKMLIKLWHNSISFVISVISLSDQIDHCYLSNVADNVAQIVGTKSRVRISGSETPNCAHHRIWPDITVIITCGNLSSPERKYLSTYRSSRSEEDQGSANRQRDSRGGGKSASCKWWSTIIHCVCNTHARTVMYVC